MGFGFTSTEAPTKKREEPAVEEIVQDAPPPGRTISATEASEILADLADTLHDIAALSDDHKVVLTAINSLIRSGLLVGEIK